VATDPLLQKEESKRLFTIGISTTIFFKKGSISHYDLLVKIS